MPLFPKPVPEDPEINGLTCPGYYQRKLAEVDAKLATQRAGYRPAYFKALRAGIWMRLFFAVVALIAMVMLRAWPALMGSGRG